MARASYSPLGTWRGRAGGQVYRVRNGQQVVSAYQPSVSNPRSSAQQQQRARFSAAAAISSLTPDAAIFGLGGTRANRRADYMRELLEKSYAMLDPTIPAGGDIKWLGFVAINELKLSRGEDYIGGQLSNITVTRQEGSVQVSAAQMTFMTEGNSLLIVDFSSNSVGSLDPPTHVYTGLLIGSNVLTFEGSGSHRIFAIPINTTSRRGVGRPIDGDVIGADVILSSQPDSSMGIEVTMSSLSSSANYGDSHFLGVYQGTVE